jgi:hypothetical protein
MRMSAPQAIFSLTASLLLIGWVAAHRPIEARGHDTKEDPDRGKPRLRLVAEPAVGFSPVTTQLTATLTGIAPDDANFCHPAVTWVRVNPGQTEETASRYHEDAACRHPDSEIAATTIFTKVLDLYQPGSYMFRLIVEGKDHRRVESAFTRVEVLKVQ